jgi:hypothetical protein
MARGDGAIIGFEISRNSRARVEVIPFAAPMPGGATLGLTGRF